jgi:putative phage-type endonuclease
MINQSQEQRRRRIGGSDIAAICGLSPWKTPLQVYMEKIGQGEGQEQTDAMSYGLMVEPMLRQFYSNTTGRTVIVPDLIEHPRYPFIVGSLDGIADRVRVWEGKTSRSSRDWGEPGSDEIPIYYMTQVQLYMMVTRLEVCDVTVSFAGTMPVNFEVPSDRELQEMLLERAVEFWKMVEKRTPPDPIGFTDAMLLFGRQSRVGKVIAGSDNVEAWTRLKVIAKETKSLEAEAEELKGKIMLTLGENDTLVDAGGKVLATWKEAKAGEMFDLKKFQAENPSLYLKYIKPKMASRRFLPK